MYFNRIFLCFFCVALLFGGCKAPGEGPAATDSVLQTGGEEEFISTLTFLGDSTTAHMGSRAKVEPRQIWAAKNRYLNLSSRITYEKIVCPSNGQEMTIAEVAATERPRRLVITLGVDYGVYYYRDEPKTFALYYEKLLDVIGAASPNTTVILQAIYPVGRASRTITNEMIKNANAVIADIAKRRALVFVDATSVLLDADGYLKEEYCYSADGIHLTASAYDAILNHIKSYESEIKVQK